ncbi:MAG: homoserine dehydrogenase [Candidatus Margulisiibacteriota bacterium]|nr:homoserine dehydrogenase [Candidatus Margulisiibacteriota bacterium]
MKKVKIGILGYGTVGAAVDKLIRKNHKEILEKEGLDLVIEKIADTNPRIKHSHLVRDAGKVIDDPEIDIIVETIGGESPAKSFVLQALRNGKHVVTSNKELIAKNMDELARTARKNGVSLLFEASVGGGIPIIAGIRDCLVANRIDEVYGIVNGTTNYILSQMEEFGKEFKDALKEAQQKGYAEADPRNDIEGYDAAFKAAILASEAFQVKVNWRDVYREGITRITQEDIGYANESGYAIKLVAIAKRHVDGKIEVRVHPALISMGLPLAYVSGAMNAIYIKADPVGEQMFYGQGAGGGPTASAVVADIISAARGQLPEAGGKTKAVIKDIADTKSRYYVRLAVPDKYGVLSKISKAFADEKVSVSNVIQRETTGTYATLIIILHEIEEKNLSAALKKIKQLHVVKSIDNVIRVGL